MGSPTVELRVDPAVEQQAGKLPILDELCVSDGPASIHVEMLSETECWMGLDLSDGRHVRCLWSIERRGGKPALVFRAEDEGICSSESFRRAAGLAGENLR